MSFLMVQMQLCSIFHPWPEYKLHMIESVGVLVPAWQWQRHKDPPLCRLWLEPDLPVRWVASNIGELFFKQSTNGLVQSLHIQAAQVAAAKARMHCATQILQVTQWSLIHPSLNGEEVTGLNSSQWNPLFFLLQSLDNNGLKAGV